MLKQKFPWMYTLEPHITNIVNLTGIILCRLSGLDAVLFYTHLGLCLMYHTNLIFRRAGLPYLDRMFALKLDRLGIMLVKVLLGSLIINFYYNIIWWGLWLWGIYTIIYSPHTWRISFISITFFEWLIFSNHICMIFQTLGIIFYGLNDVMIYPVHWLTSISFNLAIYTVHCNGGLLTWC